MLGKRGSKGGILGKGREVKGESGWAFMTLVVLYSGSDGYHGKRPDGGEIFRW